MKAALRTYYDEPFLPACSVYARALRSKAGPKVELDAMASADDALAAAVAAVSAPAAKRRRAMEPPRWSALLATALAAFKSTVARHSSNSIFQTRAAWARRRSRRRPDKPYSF